MSSASDTSLLGAAGEYYVMSQLLMQGYIAALAPQGVPNADIVVTSKTGSHLCTIQVKTRSGKGSDGGWHMKQKHEKLTEARLFYCFVDFKNTEEKPDVYVLPSEVVAEVLFKSHRSWLDKPAKNGAKHKDSVMRRLLPDYSKSFGDKNPYPKGWLNRYYNNWASLGLQTTDPTEVVDE